MGEFMQQTIDALDTSRPLLRPPAQSARRTTWRTSGAQPAMGQDDQFEVAPAGAVSTVSPAGKAVQSSSDAEDPVGPGAAKSTAEHRARPVEPVRVLTPVSPAVHCEKAIKEKCPKCTSTGLGRTKLEYLPAVPDGVRGWPVKLSHQSTIGVAGGAGGGSTRIISLRPLNAAELAKRLYSKKNLWP
eukprot:6694242-Pyramimonas_sp.AAC.1